MHRFFRNAIALALCLTLMFGAAIVVRRLAPPTPFALLFAAPDGTPCRQACLFGARAGETTYQEALDLLNRHPLTRDLARRERISTAGTLYEGVEMIVEVQGDAWGRLVQISLHFQPNYVQRLRLPNDSLEALPHALLTNGSMGETVAAIGIPDYVRLDGGRELRLYYQFSGLTFYYARRNERLNPSDTLTSLYMYAVPFPESPSLLAWSGFTSSERYYARVAPRSR
ncbi:MAG: hypothetical protein CUN51_04930 [Candidatus Thermofonsia Clade 1 bacterium]|uniref:Uncharacterized protein n=1 Tax=Candidatus Thermofonsia Clade 1 bacterium TaxID=2364210 RepID=A0A2M8P0Z5_9CHLR|nr:MAG: hypothetical protein CUN51_04930 [Candidatus Thermofonsia Clade 1 bacterium]